jgi:nicotinate-nucleotide adenylyltransferase
VRHSLALDRVLLVVANQPWQKEGSREISAAEDRFALVAAAVAHVDGLEASRIELDRGGSSYTADTLRVLADGDPGAHLFTVLGGDAAAGLTTWERYEEVVALSTLVVVERPGSKATLPDGFRWVHVEVPHLEVSSTDLRGRFVDGRPLDYLIPRGVIAEIRARRMYGAGG